MEDLFGLEACKKSVIMYIETYHENPFELLGRWTVRAKQDVFFNKTMITALLQYIDEHEIKWDDK